MSAPRPYDLGDPAELARLHNELEGYMRVSLKDGTDTEGRAHAYAALCALNRGWTVPHVKDRAFDPLNDYPDHGQQ